MRRCAGVTVDAPPVAWPLERRRHTHAACGRGVATPRGAPQGAACGPLPAGRLHRPFASLLCYARLWRSTRSWRRLAAVTVAHSPTPARGPRSAGGERVWDGDGPAGNARSGLLVQGKALLVADDAHDPFRRASIPPLDHR